MGARRYNTAFMWMTEHGRALPITFRQILLAAAAYLVLALLFFPALLKGWVISSSDVLYFYPPGLR